MRRPSTIIPPVGRFADALLAGDLPGLPDDRRERTTEFVEQRVSTLPSFTRFGVVVISFTVDLVGRLVGLERTVSLVTAKPLPLLAEYHYGSGPEALVPYRLDALRAATAP